MTDTRNATAADAELILRLYDLRREPEMRKARNFVSFEFWPSSFEDMKGVLNARGTDENRYCRQACSYWDMACSLVVRGALNADLFYDSNGEAYFLYAKIKPFLKQIREMMSPEFLVNVERVAESSAQGRERVAAITKRIEGIKAMMASAKK
jgi:hypothetical protein